MHNTLLDRLLTLQTVIWASLAIFFGSAVAIWTRPMGPKELTLGLLCGVGAFIVFGVAAIAELITPTLVEIRLRLHHLELHHQANTIEAEIVRLRATMRQLLSRSPATPRGRPITPYILPDPDEASDESPVETNNLSASPHTS